MSTPMRWPLVSGLAGVMMSSGVAASNVAVAPSTRTAETTGPAESSENVARSCVMSMSRWTVAEICLRTGSYCNDTT
jgi:hypothetical protein